MRGFFLTIKIMDIKPEEFKVTERFIQYVQIDTQSDHNSESFPSTGKQKDLARLLVKQLLEIGITDAHMDEHGYVFATVPSNTDKQVPVICFCAHMDTSPDCSGYNVKPIIHRNYQGQDLILPDDTNQVLKQSEHPDLSKQHGNDIITASGTTLLGADNKAGVAEIMDAVELLINHPEIKHGDIRILFTPDEEVGRGVEMLDMAKLAADFGYTVDGETLGSIEDETFSADAITINIQGVSTHPGFAKGTMISAIKIAGELLEALPKDRLSPETTSGREGFIHPVAIQGTVEEAFVQFIVRDFDDTKLKDHEAELETITRSIMTKYSGCTYRFIVNEQYRNMKNILKDYPEVTNIGIEAMERLGIKTIKRSIRGGTDGSRLSFMGLPCPNIFAGEHAFHGKQEWVSVQDMHQAVLTIIMIAKIWEERALPPTKN